MPKSTAKTILDNTITNFVCIDDEFSAPFDESVKPLAREMYNAFHTKFKNIKLIKYHDGMETENIKLYFSNADIVILDWELSKINIQANLDLLSAALQEHHVKYVFIYTNNKSADAEDSAGIEEIRKKLLLTFGDYLDHDALEHFKQKFIQDCEEKNWLNEDEIDNLIKFYEDKVIENLFSEKKFDEKALDTELLTKITEINNAILTKDLCPYLKSELPNYHQILKSFLRANIVGDFPSINLPFAIKNLKEDIYSVNGKLLHVISKQHAEPNALLESIYQVIIQESDSFFNILNHEVLALFKKHFLSRAKEIAQIDSGILKEHTQVNPENQKGMTLEELVNGVYSDIFTSVLRNNKLSFLEKSNEFLSTTTTESNVDDKIKYINYLISIDHDQKDISTFRTEQKIEFGDIFEIIDENSKPSKNRYVICITPQCDCAHPEKIGNVYTFAFSTAEVKSLDDQNFDSYFCSFVPTSEGIKIIQWNGGEFIRPQQVAIEESTNNITLEIQGNSPKNSYKLKFIAQQKENFTQRLVNESSRRGIRVGVSYLNKHCTKNASECCS